MYRGGVRGSVKRSVKKRKYNVENVQGSSEEVKYFQYDDLHNTCVDIRDCMRELATKRLKRCKPGSPETPIDLQVVREYAKNTFHKHVYKFNKELGIEFSETEELETRHREEVDRLRNEHRGESDKLKKEIKNCKQELTARNNYIKELEQKYRTQEDALKKSQEEIDRIQQKHKNESEKYTKELEQKYKTQEDALRQSQEEIKRIQQEHENEMKKYQQQQNARLQQTLHDKGKDGERLQLENQQIRQEYQALEQLAHNLNQQIQESNAEIHRLKEEVERKNGNIHQLQRQLNEEREKKESEKKQKDEALTRLSAIAGDRLRSNNPGITDLSDPNRPMKIAEKFAELYDNDWTDAMETLENNGLEEKECIGILLHFLTDAYEECGKRVKELDSFLEQAVLMSAPNGQADQSGDSGQELPAEITKPIKDLRRKLTDNNIEVLQKILPQHLKEKRNLTEDQVKDCEDFIKDCIKYAWMMQIQDPPVNIEWEFPEDTKIDTNILRSYTKAGEKVDYIVWPVLYLHKNGPVLNKGVVQPISTKKQ